MSRTKIVTALLVLSVGANVYLVVSSKREAPAKRSASERSDADQVDGDGSRLPRRATGCMQRLRRRQSANWKIVAATIRDQAENPTPPAKPGGVAEKVKPTTASVQAEFRNKIAADFLKHQWLRQQKRIVKKIVHDLSDDATQKRQLDRQIGRVSKTLGLSAPEQDLLRERYEPVRKEHMQRLAQVIGGEAPDYAKAVEILRELFAATDSVVFSNFGGEARDRVRAAQLRQRTMILSMAATFAGLDWNDPKLNW